MSNMSNTAKYKKPVMKSQKAFDAVAWPVLTLISLICLLPFILILSGSFTANEVIVREGFSLFPKQFSLEAYQNILSGPQKVLSAYWVTIRVTLIGTAVGLIMISLTGYVLSRKEFTYRNQVSFLIYFTTIFGGGLIPYYYVMCKMLDLKGTLTAQWLPGILSPFLIILMRTFIRESVPDELCEAAKIDGAGYGTVFVRIVLPVLKPALATIGLFLALGYWNDWYRASLFSVNQETWSLQFYLYNMVNKSNSMNELAISAGILIQDLPTESVKMAMAILVTGPILVVYPFVQKYFVQGITVGAVKG